MADQTALVPLYRCPACRKGGFKSLHALTAHFKALDHSLICAQCNYATVGDAWSFVRHFQRNDDCESSCDLTSIMYYRREKQNAVPQRPLAKEGAKRSPNPQAKPQPTMSTNTQQSTILKESDAYQNLAQNTALSTDTINSLTSSIDKLSIGDAPVYTVTQEARLTNIPTDLNTQHCMSQGDMGLEYLQAKRHSLARLQAEGYFLGLSHMTKDQRGGKRALRDEDYLQTPTTFSTTKRTAIVVDCEMVGLVGGRSAVVSLSAIDFFTGEVLIDTIVNPTERVIDWRARYSGVSLARMRRACASGEALRGWKAARQRLWGFMDVNTILIGHSLDNDLEVLGILHHNIVDTAILTAEAVFLPTSHTTRMRRRWGLKPLADELLKRDIQVGKGHSALEDASATRDVLFWCMCNPYLLQAWAGQNRVKEEKRVADEKAKRAAASDAKKKLAADAKGRRHIKEREPSRKQSALQTTTSSDGYNDGYNQASQREGWHIAPTGYLRATLSYE